MVGKMENTVQVALFSIDFVLVITRSPQELHAFQLDVTPWYNTIMCLAAVLVSHAMRSCRY